MKRITPAWLMKHPLPDHDRTDDKRERGKVLVVAGSVEIAGAAYLAALSVLRSGAGILQVATVASAAPHLRIAMPEALVVGCEETGKGGINPSALERLVEMASASDAVLVGPGMVDDEAISELTLSLVRSADRPKFVLDAAAFVQMRAHSKALKSKEGKVLLTPHAGEMAAFLKIDRQEVEGRPCEIAREVAASTGAIVALKGATTYVASPEGEIWKCDRGCVGLATSGSGDTLAGIFAGIVARGSEPSLAACWATYVHAEAGQRLTKKHHTVGFLARELPDVVPAILSDLKTGGSRRDAVPMQRSRR